MCCFEIKFMIDLLRIKSFPSGEDLGEDYTHFYNEENNRKKTAHRPTHRSY